MDVYDIMVDAPNLDIHYHNSSNVQMIGTHQNWDCVRDDTKDIIVYICMFVYVFS